MNRHLLFSVFAASLLALASGCGKKAVGGGGDGGTFDIPPSLVQRMTLAHNAARDKMLADQGEDPGNIDGEEFMALAMAGWKNAEQIATRPRGKMVFADDGLDEAGRRALWPFDFETFEASLEERLGREEHGLFCLKDEEGEPSTPSNPTFRWVNEQIETWAVEQLDARFGRLDEETFRAMHGGTAPSDDMRGWPIDRESGEYFFIGRTDGAWNLREYIYLRWDGEGDPVSFAQFESFPSRREAVAMRTLLKEPAALNNMAALIWEHRVDRLEMDPQGLKTLLELAARQGVACAKDNLAVLRAHIPEVDE